MGSTEVSNDGAAFYHGNIYMSGAVLEQYRRLRTNGGNVDVRKSGGYVNSDGAIPITNSSRSLVPTNRYSVYHHNGGDQSRHQSIPSKWDTSKQESQRQVNSAPATKPEHTTVPLPKLNNIIVTRGNPGHAGMTTRGRESYYLRTDKFASAWAKARVDHGNITRHSEKTDQDVKSRTGNYQAKSNPDNTVQSVSGRSNGHSIVNETRGQQHSAKSNPESYSEKVTTQSDPKMETPVSRVSHPKSTESAPRNLSEARPSRTSYPKSANSHKGKDTTNTRTNSGHVQSDNNAKTNDGTEVRDRPVKHLARNNIWTNIRKKQRQLREKATHRQTRSQKAQPIDEDTAPREHHPVVNDLKKVVKLYTTMTIVAREFKSRSGKRPTNESEDNRDRISGGSSTVPPWHRKEYVLTRREAHMYQHINQVYGVTNRNQRQVDFYNKLEELQEKQVQEHNENLDKKQKDSEESAQRQQRQLKNVRNKFFDERIRRFSRQYVTSKALEYEKLDRDEYGLPEEYTNKVENPAKLNRRKVERRTSVTDQPHVRRKNMKKYGAMFDAKKAPRFDQQSKRPKMEGIDTVMLEERDEQGNVIRERKRSVQYIVQDAEKYLTIPRKEAESLSTSGQTSEMKSGTSIDLDNEDDLFEQARRKYGLDMDSDDEDDDDMNDKKSI